MFRSGRDAKQGRTLNADLCIIGAGPAGLAIAGEFAGTKTRVLILESGGEAKDKATSALAKGKKLGRPYTSLENARVRMFGGASARWAGICRPFEPLDFEEREWVPNSGWPFDRTHLDPFYARAQQFWGLGPYEYESDYWVKGKAKPLDFRGSPVRSALFQRAMGRRRLAKVLTKDFKAYENVDVWLWSNVREIVLGAAGDSVTHLDVRVLDGPKFKVKAKAYVLATGGIENPRILLASNSVQKAGIGNQNDLVGRFFMEHPHTFHDPLLVAGPKLIDNWDYYRSKSHGRGEQRYKTWGSFNLDPAHLRKNKLYTLQTVFFELGRRADKIKHVREPVGTQDVERLVYPMDSEHAAPTDFDDVKNKFTFGILSEQEPNPSSRVLLIDEIDALGMPRVGLDWNLTDADKRSIQTMHELLAEAFARGGYGRVNTRNRTAQKWVPKRTKWGFHHMGTTRMHIDPKRGVCDPDGRVHGVGNLYVAGGSLFPTSGGSNPTLTIVALALRLADHLKKDLSP